jgi:hypothetical protein
MIFWSGEADILNTINGMFRDFFGGWCGRTAGVGALSVLMLFGYVHTADAALLYFNPDSVSVHRGDSATIALRLDTDTDECVNTVSGVIHYDPSIRAIDVSLGNSILNIWVEKPVIDEANHTISFAGGLPGGYCGRIAGDPSLTNVLLEIVFRSPGLQIGGGADASAARLWLDETTQVLLHDGFATPAPVRTQEGYVELLATANTSPSDSWRETILDDAEPPADFTVTLTKDESAFSGQYFIVFNSSDKQSGIDHYEVMEEPFDEFMSFRWGRADAPWHITESPYVLNDQTLNSTIHVKAVDKAGNERIVRLVPDTALRGLSTETILTLLGVAALLVVVGAIAGYILWKRRRNSLSLNDTTS